MPRFLIALIALSTALLSTPLSIAATSPPRAATSDFPPVRLAPEGIQPAFEAIDGAGELSSSQVLEVVSDRHGFIWIGSDRGVQRFDGHNFFRIDRDPDRPDTLESRFVYLLAESRDAMWIGSPNGTLQRLDSRTGELAHVPVTYRGASPQGILWIACDALGQLWQMSDLGLLRLDARGGTTWVMPRSLDAMAFNPDRTQLFVAMPDRRVVSIDVRDPTRLSTVLSLPEGIDASIVAMSADAKGLWLGIGRELWRFDSASASLRRIEMPVPLFRITFITRAPDGALWLGSWFDEGLYRFDPASGRLSVFRNDPEDPLSLRPGVTTALTIDRSNNLWIAQDTSGLSRLHLGQPGLSRYRPQEGRNICAMEEIDGRLIAALCRSGLVELDRGTGLPRPLAASLPFATRALESDGKGGLWVASGHQGLIHWQPDGSVRQISLKPAHGVTNPAMTGVYRAPDGRVWVSHHMGLAVLDPGSSELRSIQAYDRGKPFAFDLVQDVSPGPDGTLWLGTMKGVLRFDTRTTQIQRYQHDRNDNRTLSDNYVLQTYTDRSGRFWVATRAGLNRLTRDTRGRPMFRRYGMDDGLPDITIEAIVSDAQDRIWVGTGRGIARWDPKQDRFQSYLPTDGVPDTDINMKSALSSADGGLYFGTQAGLWRIDPETIQIADPRPVVLSSYEVGERTSVNLQGNALAGVKARYADGRVVFRVAVLGDARRLAYRLEGLDDSWREMPSDLSITFHWLPPGDYRLQVRQLQRNGTWGTPELSLPVEITPPPWRTGWAYMLYAIVAIALLVALARAFMAWRHRALREQLKESHARLSVALHAARFGMWAWDVNTDEAELDPHARELLAVPEGMQPVASLFSRMHPDDGPRIRAEVTRALQEDAAVDFEFRVSDPSRDGWTWVEGHAVPYHRPGKAPYVIGVNRDATQRKRELLELEQSKRAAEQALEELTRSRLDLALALESGDLGVWRSAVPAGHGDAWVRDEGVDCDANIRSIFGWPADVNVDRRLCLRAIHPADRRRVLARLQPVLRGGGSYADLFRIRHPDGKTRCIAVRAVCVLAAQGSSLTGIVHDVTVEEALKEGLQQAAEEARLATEAKGRFLATMSHEIRTPINGVIGMVELLLDTPLGEEQQHMLGTCKDSAYMLLALINDILDFSKIEAGKLKLEHAPLSPRRLVESVVESLRNQAARKGIELDVFVEPDVPRRVMGDRVRVRQVLTNLIGNAIKFTAQGGVRIDIAAPVHDGHPMLRLDVIDTGIGMAPETLERLFEPFEQADVATTRRFGGTGLGLAIVKHLVSLMEGTIECRSTMGSGSHFSVLLPMEPAAKGTPREHALPATRVIALCDAGRRTTLLRELGHTIGVDVVPVSSADALQEQLAQARATTGHVVVLLDKTRMQQHDAICRLVREDAANAGTPIIVVRPDSQRRMPCPPGTSIVGGSPLTAASLERSLLSALGLASPIVQAIAIEPIPSAAIDGTAATILVADDNAINREVISRQLRRLGHAVDVAEDGEQAWEMLQAGRDRYRLLLTDCHMPRLDGYGLTERIRRDEQASGRPHLNIVAITANALVGEGERCLSIGMDAFLTKPVQMSELTSTLERMLTVPETTREDVRPRFGTLSTLARDDDTLHRLLGSFAHNTRADLDRWVEACASGDFGTLKALAHKLKSGCRQLDEESSASALEAVERHAGTGTELELLATAARIELERTLERVDEFLRRHAHRVSS